MSVHRGDVHHRRPLRGDPLGLAPADTQQTDTYYIVAHFHYVIFGGIVLGLFSGFYFWWPKVFGYKLSETQGKLGFWVMLLGFNLTFGPMHILGLQGQARRHQSYAADDGFGFWNFVVSVGAFILALAVAMFVINIVTSYLKHRANPVDVGPDPWDARSLEWSTASPTPVHNFDRDPIVEYQDDWWHRKWGRDETGKVVRKAYPADIADDGSNTEVHLPSPSYWPLVIAASLPIIAYSIIYTFWLLIPAGVLFLAGFIGWALEPPDDPEAAHDHHDDHGDDDHHAAGGIIDPLTEQVFAKTPLLALDHVGQRLQGPVAAAENGTLAAVVVEQGVDRLLQHPLFVADNHFRRVQVDQLLAGGYCG